MEILVLDEKTKQVKARYKRSLELVDVDFKPANFKGKSTPEGTREVLAKMQKTGARSGTFEALGFLTDIPGEYNPDCSNGKASYIKVQLCNDPQETIVLPLEPISAAQRARADLGIKLRYRIQKV